jgi:hypothetical protein
MAMKLEEASNFQMPWIGKELRHMKHQDWRLLRNRIQRQQAPTDALGFDWNPNANKRRAGLKPSWSM